MAGIYGACVITDGRRGETMSYWACAQLLPRRENLAVHCLGLAGYSTYIPRLRETRVRRGHRVEATPMLFPGYAFVAIELQWHAARWSVGVIRLVMDGQQPARVPDSVIDGIKARERSGLVELPKRGLQRGDRVRILRGPFNGHLAIFADMKPRDRIEVLLALLGAQQRVILAAEAVEMVR